MALLIFIYRFFSFVPPEPVIINVKGTVKCIITFEGGDMVINPHDEVKIDNQGVWMKVKNTWILDPTVISVTYQKHHD